MRSRKLWWRVVAAIPIAGLATLLAVVLTAAPGQASASHAITGSVSVSGQGGTAVLGGTVNAASLPTASPSQLRQAKPLATNRPLQSASQLAAYQQYALSHPGSLPAGAAQAAPSSTSFLSSSQQIPKLVRSGNGTTFTQSGCGCTPPDQALGNNGSVVFEGVNNSLQAFNKSLGTVYGPVSTQAFFAPVFHSGDFFSDPQITYDPTISRWLVTWLEIQPNGSSSPDYIDFAISKSKAENGTYSEYQIPSSVSGSTDFCDYDTMGYDSNGMWVSCTTFSTANGSFLGNRVFGFSLSEMKRGVGVHYAWFNNLPTPDATSPGGAYRLSPATEDGTPQAEFVTTSDAGFGITSSKYELCAITNTAALAAGRIPTASCQSETLPVAYDNPINADQPGHSGSVYPGFGTKQIAYRDGRLWVAQPESISCAGNTEDGIWWADFIPQLTAISSGYPQTVSGIAGTENGTWCYSGDIDSYMPSIEPDSEGGAALTFNISNDASIYPSLVFTGRSATDPVNTMGGVGASAYYWNGSAANTTGRYGDYSACSLAPGLADRGTEWCAGEYGGSDVWNTAIADLQSQ